MVRPKPIDGSINQIGGVKTASNRGIYLKYNLFYAKNLNSWGNRLDNHRYRLSSFNERIGAALKTEIVCFHRR